MPRRRARTDLSPVALRLVKAPQRDTLSPGRGRASHSARRPLVRYLGLQIQDFRQMPRPLAQNQGLRIQDFRSRWLAWRMVYPTISSPS